MKVLEDVPNVVAATSYQRYLDCREPRRSHKGFVRKAWESTLQHLTLLWEHQGEDASATVNCWAYPLSCWKPWGERDCLPIFLRTDANYLPQAEADLGEFPLVWPVLEFLVRPPYLKRVSHWSTTVGPHSPHLRTGEQRPQLKPIVLWAPKDAKAMMPHAQPDLATVPSPGKECSSVQHGLNLMPQTSQLSLLILLGQGPRVCQFRNPWDLCWATLPLARRLAANLCMHPGTTCKRRQ